MADGQQKDSWVPVPALRSRKNSNASDSDGTLANKTKAARKNERRRERRRQHKLLMGQPNGPGGDDPSLSRARQRDGGVSDEDEELSRALEASCFESSAQDPRPRRLRNLRKKLVAAEALLSKPEEELNDFQRAKVARIPELLAEASGLESELKSEASAREEADRSRREAEAQSQRRRLAEWEAFERGKVVQGFEAGNDEHACPICSGPLEAATEALPCRHLFCRACLEEAMEKAASASRGDPISCVCPMCRGRLYDPETGMIRTASADAVKRRMRKRKCTCRCGTVVSLSSLRQHLRACDEAAPSLFEGDERKRFGHTFEQPWLDPEKCAALLGNKSKVKKGRGRSTSFDTSQQQHFSPPTNYDEDAEIQAAILLSLLVED